MNGRNRIYLTVLAVLLIEMCSHLQAQVAEQDSLALVALYNSTNGSGWTNGTNWLTGPVSTWFGITVAEGRVTGVDLNGNNLTGDLPVELGNLENLSYLSFNANQLTGSIPAEIGNLTQLYQLYLSNNQLDGSIPEEIQNLTNLNYVNLENNQLSGFIPSGICDLTNLIAINLSYNQLTGSIPSEIGNLLQCKYLYLNSNQLTDSIPPEIGSLVNLEQINIGSNQFSGSLPLGMDNLIKCKTIDLSYNQLTGAIPLEWTGLTQLTSLNLTYNLFVDLPNLSSLSLLNALWVNNNRLTFEDIEPNIGISNFSYSPQDSVGEAQDTTVEFGAGLILSVSVGGANNQYQWYHDYSDIPSATSSEYVIGSATYSDAGTYVCRITNTVATELMLYSRPIEVSVTGAPPGLVQDSLALVTLYDSTDGAHWTNHENWLVGPVNTWHGITVFDWRVTEVRLDNNNLSGKIPVEIGNLDSLETLSLSINQLSDTLPSAIGRLQNLYSLYLYNNQLTGPIPAEIGNLKNLHHLYLNNNQLSGPLPPEIGALTNLAYLELNDNGLSDNMPPQIGNLMNLTGLGLYRNNFSGPIPKEIGNLSNLESLDLFTNQLSDPIPPEIGNLTNLNYLNVMENRLTGSIPEEIGTMANLREISLSNNQLSGAVPDEIVNLVHLTNINITRNRLDGLPDLSPMTGLSRLSISYNRFTFEDIEPNIGITTFVYSPQDSVEEEQDVTVTEGESLSLSVIVGGTANQYQWYQEGSAISGANSPTHEIEASAYSDSGSYTCQITNAIATALTLYSRPIYVHVLPGTGVTNHDGVTPAEFALFQNYPNPFNPETTMRFDVKEPCRVVLKVYNLMGQEVSDLVNEDYPFGQYEIKFNATGFSSSIYFYKIQMGDFQTVKKMVVLE